MITFSEPIVAWSMGGLEAPLQAFLVAWAVLLGVRTLEGQPLSRQFTGIGLPLALLVLTRPDGALFTALLAIAIATLRGGKRWFRTVWDVAWMPATTYLLQSAFRLLYHGDFTSNTARAKVAFTVQRVEAGFAYVSADSFWTSFSLTIGAMCLVWGATLIALPASRPRGRRTLLPVVLAFLWVGYVVAMGGDNMPRHRFLVPFHICIAVGTAEMVRSAYFVRKSPFRTLLLTIVAVLVLGHARSSHEIEIRPAWASPSREGWVFEGERAGRFLRAAFQRERPLVATDPAGALPYYSRLPALDMLGLTDRYLATHPPPSFGTGWVGHELGDGAYVLERRPDLIFFGNFRGDPRPVWEGGRQMFRMPAFRENYFRAHFVTDDGLHLQPYMRRDGRLGPQRGRGVLRIPPWLFARGANEGWLRGDRFSTYVVPGGQVAVEFKAPWQDYQVEVDADESVAVQENRLGDRVLRLTVTAPNGGWLDGVLLRRRRDG